MLFKNRRDASGRNIIGACILHVKHVIRRFFFLFCFTMTTMTTMVKYIILLLLLFVMYKIDGHKKKIISL